MTPNTPTRRTLLTTSTAALTTTALTGCLNLTNDTTTTTNATQDQGSKTFGDSSPLTSIEVDSTDLIVRFEEESELSRVNLINEDGTAFAQRSVKQGAGAVRIQLLDPGVRRISENHYSPGEYTIVAVTPEAKFRETINLKPTLELVDVQAEYDDEEQVATGNLEVTVENNGSGPGWVYQIVYDGAPASDANTSLGDHNRVPGLTAPSKPKRALLAPGETQSYIGKTRPLKFSAEDESSCTYSPDNFEMLVGTGLGDTLEARIDAEVSGDVRREWDYHICTDTSVEFERVQEGIWD